MVVFMVVVVVFMVVVVVFMVVFMVVWLYEIYVYELLDCFYLYIFNCK